MKRSDYQWKIMQLEISVRLKLRVERMELRKDNRTESLVEMTDSELEDYLKRLERADHDHRGEILVNDLME